MSKPNRPPDSGDSCAATGDYFVLDPELTDPRRIRKEREKAQKLKKSAWWHAQLQKGVCHYCGQAFPADRLTMDHVVPIARGGTSTPGNIVPACSECNRDKKLMTPAERIMKDLEARPKNHKDTIEPSAWGGETKFFFELTPDRVLEAVEESGLRCTGRCLALNSFENRVYDVELESEAPESASAAASDRRVVKFYRPGRWSREQILEEHQFLADLAAAEIPAVAALPFPDGTTLHQNSAGIWFTIFPKVGGRAPDELTDEQLKRIGRLLGRVHNVGAEREAKARILIGPETYGRANLEFLLAGDWLPVEFRGRYEEIVEKILGLITPWFEGLAIHRIHGDCHLGNLLSNQNGYFFVDFDDMVRGPAVQDIWLLVPGRDAEAVRQREVLLEGYEEMRAFDRSTLRLIEPLRALRFIHYSAWLARRWQDPAFPAAFPEFGTHRYWADETQDLADQLELIGKM